jgi:uncharacterized membrane protein YphA (DoxX/SURF4 family)
VTVFARYRLLFTNFLHERNREQLAITIFCKSLYAFLVLKIFFLWPVLPDSQRYLPYEFRSFLHHIIYAPIKLAQYDLNIFLISIIGLLLLSLVLKVNYITAALIFWLSLNLSRLAYPFVNGSDYVLNLFLFFSIFLSVTPTFKSETLRTAQYGISNFAFLFCKIQLALIYILSGFDKLTSPAWRSGDAIYSILHLEFFMNPHLTIPESKTLYVVIAWIVILFELSFPVLIWFERLRIYALVAGIIFHIAIIFILSLPDFGLVMILLYSLFIPFAANKGESDYASNLR